MLDMAGIYQAVLTRRPHLPIVVLAVIGALPILMAAVDHSFADVRGVQAAQLAAKCTVPRGGASFSGMVSSPNWWIFVFVLPFSVFLLRSIIRHTLGETIGSDPQLSALVSAEARGRVSARVRARLLTRWLPALAIVLVGVVAFLDMREVVLAYVRGNCPSEKDWTVFFLIIGHGTSRTLNAIHVGVAYFVQYFAGVMALLAFALAFAHNILYVQLIYQRRRSNDPAAFIALDLEDPVCCFGQAALRPGFRLQVWYVVIAGIVVAVSRYHNVSIATMKTVWDGIGRALAKKEVFEKINGIWEAVRDVQLDQLYPDAGQWSLAILFAVVFLVVSIPSVIKFLPFGRRGMLSAGDPASYLAEFIPAGVGQEPTKMSRDELKALTGKFASNSFWPAGDSVAQRLFAFAFAVFIFILLPAPVRPPSVVVIYMTLVIACAFAATASVFSLYRWVLAYIGEDLVKKEGE
jgi:hypothetical protein